MKTQSQKRTKKKLSVRARRKELTGINLAALHKRISRLEAHMLRHYVGLAEAITKFVKRCQELAED